MVKVLMAILIVWLPKSLHLHQAWDAIVEVESNGDANAIGDNGAAIGVGQIHKVMVDDVNRIIGVKRYTYEDRLDPIKSREMFVVYCLHYFPNGDIEQWARAWNGGPRGPFKASTIPYWEKVHKVLVRNNK